MKLTKYECNLCGDKYELPEAYKKIFAYYCVKQQFPTGSTFELNDINANTDRHICTNCIDTIKKSVKP
jgi:hypothetical protein